MDQLRKREVAAWKTRGREKGVSKDEKHKYIEGESGVQVDE